VEKPRDWKRPVIVLAALGALTVAALAAPASAHLGSFGHLKKHIKKIAKKVAKKEATTIVQTTVGPTVFIEETELMRFGPIEMQTGAPDVTVGTFGPFTLTTDCSLDAGDVEGTLFVATSEANSTFFSSFWGEEDDFDPTDTGVFWLNLNGDVPGGAADISFGGNQMHAGAPSGTSLQGMATVATNFSGSHCVFWGTVTTVAPA
jgi:hypothetical protein